MCQTVVTLDGRWLTSIEQLQEEYGVEFEDPDHEPNSCLCGVDVAKLLDRVGVEYDDSFPGFIDIIRKE